ncbi:hypothetical protein BV25DRAFT_1262873 [Artomyces pyxidatus]|uniref:Uncharacterized protein n=1 Tax=Artomyces pyxidatus TaxID=48021 RepID=A0ACB8TEX0_9AGAM|nr:hypothetical protein BV25DRAFT_1262873 [Artomyces pyxidatus]
MEEGTSFQDFRRSSGVGPSSAGVPTTRGPSCELSECGASARCAVERQTLVHVGAVLVKISTANCDRHSGARAGGRAQASWSGASVRGNKCQVNSRSSSGPPNHHLHCQLVTVLSTSMARLSDRHSIARAAPLIIFHSIVQYAYAMCLGDTPSDRSIHVVSALAR